MNFNLRSKGYPYCNGTFSRGEGPSFWTFDSILLETLFLIICTKSNWEAFWSIFSNRIQIICVYSQIILITNRHYLFLLSLQPTLTEQIFVGERNICLEDIYVIFFGLRRESYLFFLERNLNYFYWFGHSLDNSICQFFFGLIDFVIWFQQTLDKNFFWYFKCEYIRQRNASNSDTEALFIVRSIFGNFRQNADKMRIRYLHIQSSV